MFQVVSRCFQILMSFNEEGWRKDSDLVVMPDVGSIPWDGFENAMNMIAAGERAAAKKPFRRFVKWLTVASSLILFPAQLSEGALFPLLTHGPVWIGIAPNRQSQGISVALQRGKDYALTTLRDKTPA